MNFEKTGYGNVYGQSQQSHRDERRCRHAEPQERGRTAEPELARRYVIMNFSSKDVRERQHSQKMLGHSRVGLAAGAEMHPESLLLAPVFWTAAF